MHDLVKAASVALSTNDAETLEQLAAEARSLCHSPLTMNLAELTRATQVLGRQLDAARHHLDLQSRMHGTVSETYKANPWAL
jgi:hypothetical protein